VTLSQIDRPLVLHILWCGRSRFARYRLLWIVSPRGAAGDRRKV